MNKIKMILDVDTGTDDAAAIAMAYLDPHIDLIGVCTVAGNRDIEYTTENTLRVKDMLKADFPVYMGCSTPMVSTLNPHRRDINGLKKENSIHTDYLNLPQSISSIEKINAIQYYIETIKNSSNDITITAVAPLTNIAMAIRLDPSICKKIKQLIIMGGGDQYTNITSSAEFNIWYDPEAAQIVMESGIPIIIVPLDSTMKARITSDDTANMKALNNPAADAVADFTDHRINSYKSYESDNKIKSAPVHDALAVCASVHPEVLTDKRLCRVDVDFSGGLADGHMIVDKRSSSDKPLNAYFSFDADSQLFRKWMINNLNNY